MNASSRIPSPEWVAGIDIGGTNVRCAIAPIDDPTRLVAHRSAETPQGVALPEFLAFLASELAACRQAAGRAPGDIAAIGCTAPGYADATTGVVVWASNLGWRNTPLAGLLEEQFGLPAVVENDVKAAAVAEHRYGAGRDRSPVVYLTVSTGVAAGIVVDGKVLRGRNHAAGEICHLVPEPVHLSRDWQPSGCLELTSAGVGLARQWAARRGTPDATAADVFAAARAGDAEAEALVRRAADYLSVAAVAVCAVLDPAVLVLGGSIAQYERPIADRIREAVAAQLPFPIDVVHAALGGDAPIVGALTLAADRVRSGPGTVSSGDGRHAPASHTFR